MVFMFLMVLTPHCPLQIDFLNFPARRMDILLDTTCSPARLSHISEKHPKITLAELNVLRRHRELCDVVLNVGSRKIFAHRVILSACSAYFRAMFTGGELLELHHALATTDGCCPFSELEESRQTEVTIRDIDENAMELLIDFCYTSHIIVEESNVQSLLPAACLLQLSEIQDICCEFLKRQLDPSNCLGIRAFADTHS
jgi:kelch-like protein 20